MKLRNILFKIAILVVAISCQKEIKESNKKIRDQGTSGLSDLKKFSSLAVKDALDMAKKPTQVLKLANIGDKSYEGCQAAQDLVFSNAEKRLQIYVTCIYEAVDYPIDVKGIYRADLAQEGKQKLIKITPSGNDVILEACIDGKQAEYLKVTKGSNGKAQKGLYYMDMRHENKDKEWLINFYRDEYTKAHETMTHDFEDPEDSSHTVHSETKEIIKFYNSTATKSLVAKNYQNGNGNAIVAKEYASGLRTTKGYYDNNNIVISSNQSEFQADLKIDNLELPRFFDYQNMQRLTEYQTWDCSIATGETVEETQLPADAATKANQCLVDLNVGAIFDFPCKIADSEEGDPVTIRDSQKSDIADIATKELSGSNP